MRNWWKKWEIFSEDPRETNSSLLFEFARKLFCSQESGGIQKKEEKSSLFCDLIYFIFVSIFRSISHFPRKAKRKAKGGVETQDNRAHRWETFLMRISPLTNQFDFRGERGIVLHCAVCLKVFHRIKLFRSSLNLDPDWSSRVQSMEKKPQPNVAGIGWSNFPPETNVRCCQISVTIDSFHPWILHRCRCRLTLFAEVRLASSLPIHQFNFS